MFKMLKIDIIYLYTIYIYIGKKTLFFRFFYFANYLKVVFNLEHL